jgi:hypothetical protein
MPSTTTNSSNEKARRVMGGYLTDFRNQAHWRLAGSSSIIMSLNHTSAGPPL